jgi:hypothetical protein
MRNFFPAKYTIEDQFRYMFYLFERWINIMVYHIITAINHMLPTYPHTCA